MIKHQRFLITNFKPAATEGSQLYLLLTQEQDILAQAWNDRRNSLDKEIKSKVLEPAYNYLGQYYEIQDRIKERHRRESLLKKNEHQVQKVKNKDEVRVNCDRSRLDTSTSAFSDLNAELKRDIPILLSNTDVFFAPVMAQLFVLQNNFFGSFFSKTTEVIQSFVPQFGAIVCPMMAITPREKSSVSKQYLTTNENPYDGPPGGLAPLTLGQPNFNSPYNHSPSHNPSYNQPGYAQPSLAQTPTTSNPFSGGGRGGGGGAHYNPYTSPKGSSSPHLVGSVPLPTTPPTVYPTTSDPAPRSSGYNPFTSPVVQTPNPIQTPTPPPPNPISTPTTPITSPTSPGFNYHPEHASVVPPLPPSLPASNVRQARALWAFAGSGPNDLPFRAGDILVIHNTSGDWWEGELNGKRGMIPGNYLQLY
eukprot:TRINITY_DN6442_c0_g2_i4.p1 TRINITY_DN6442_c0_g2~~TRINITY_DN6442_c0_g2_i4.p1  ORF type:complete len:419 (-),score=93.64 TRINITY_DN6442_c0_g2_i4:108-1364(-)